MLIGSQALAYWNPEFTPKPNADWDFIGEQTVEVPDGARIEIHPIEDLNNHKALLFDEEGVCSILGLGLIKRSHLWRTRQFDKHITMYHKYLLPYCREISGDEEFLVERIKLSKEAYPQSNPTLNKTNEDFFDDAVDKVYDHDYLHTLYAYGDEPMYERLKKSDSMDKAWCEKDLWLGLSDDERNKCVAEECYVIATERFLVPKDWNFNGKRAYYAALEKVCTTLTSGWFRYWAIDHYPEVVYLYDQGKIEDVKGELGG